MSDQVKLPIPRSFGILLDEPEFASPTATPAVAVATVVPTTLFVEGSLYRVPSNPSVLLIEGHWRRGNAPKGDTSELTSYDGIEDLADQLNWSPATMSAFARRVQATLSRHT